MFKGLWKNSKLKWLYVVLVVVFTVTFTLGIFGNPNFNIYDFCMNMASEILGMVIALVIVEAYVREKEKVKEARAAAKRPPQDAQEETK